MSRMEKLGWLGARIFSVQHFKNVVSAMKKRHPEWTEDFVEGNLRTMVKYAPSILADLNLVEQLLKKVYMYGSIEPSMLKELAELEEAFSKNRRW